MISRTFIWKEWEETGEMGFMPAWMTDAANPSTGQAIPHDMLEHFDRNYYPCIDELMALGAVYFTRFEAGSEPLMARRYGNRSSYPEATSNDIVAVLRCKMESMDSGRTDTFLPPPRTRRLKPIGGLDIFDLAADQGIGRFISEYYYPEDEDTGASTLSYILDATGLTRDGLDAFISGWLRYGYRQAKRRYQNHNYLRGAFEVLERLANKAATMMTDYGVDMGTKVTFSVDLREQRAFAKIHRGAGGEHYEFDHELVQSL